MTRIDPTAFYSRADLDQLLRPLGVDVDGWLAKVRPLRRFRLLYWGGDLITAIEATTPLGAAEGPSLAAEGVRAAVPGRKGARRPSNRRDAPGELLRREFISPSRKHD